MDRHPDFRFNQSTAQLYAFLEEDDPALFAQIKEKVAAGQWEPIGAMWVEPDTNMPTGEVLRPPAPLRPALFRADLRPAPHRLLAARLLRLLAGAAAAPAARPASTSFFTIKVNWSETNTMPYDLFWWEGLDGSRVLAHTFNNPVGGYNAEIGPRADRRDLEELPRQAPPPREPARLRLWRRRRRPDRGDARAPAAVRRLPRRARAPPGQRRGLVRRGPRRRRRQPRPAGLGRRDLSRAPPRHPDHARAAPSILHRRAERR